MVKTVSKYCIKCKKTIVPTDLYKIVMYVVGEEFTDHHYEHIECPDKFTA